jgi:hypothetical protein
VPGVAFLVPPRVANPLIRGGDPGSPLSDKFDGNVFKKRKAQTMIMHRNIADWRRKRFVDRDGHRIGKLEDIYVDVATEQPMFGTLNEGVIGRPLTFVSLAGITIGPRNVQVALSKQQVKDAPQIELRGDQLSQAEESTLYHHYQLHYTRPDTESGRRLARR